MVRKGTKKQACVKTVEIAEVVFRVPVLVLIPFLNDSLDSKQLKRKIAPLENPIQQE